MDGSCIESWEGVARAVHDATGLAAPVDARELAGLCGLELQPSSCRGGAYLERGVVYYDAQARPQRQHGLIAHEVAHHVLQLHGEADTEQAARYTGGALLVPRAAYDRDLRETWDLDLLRARHPNASAELLARRVAELRDAVITVLDEGRVRTRVRSPWMPAPPVRLTAVERELADAALASGEPQRANALLGAWPLLDGMHRRVIVIAEARQLSLRL